MATNAQLRAGLLTRLQTIAGLRAHAKWPGNIEPPAALVRRLRTQQHTTFSGNGSVTFEITVAVSKAGDLDRAQTALDEYTSLSGDRSIVAALEGDMTLGGVAEYLLIGEWGEDEDLGHGNKEFLSASLPVEVHTTY